MEGLDFSLGRLEGVSLANKGEVANWEWLWWGLTAAIELQHHPVYVKFMLIIDRNQCWIRKHCWRKLFLSFLLKGNTLWKHLLYVGYNSASSEKKWRECLSGPEVTGWKAEEERTWDCNEEQILGKSEVLGQLWGGKTGEVGGVVFTGNRGHLPLTVYQDLGGTHLLRACELGILLQDLTLGLLS